MPCGPLGLGPGNDGVANRLLRPPHVAGPEEPADLHDLVPRFLIELRNGIRIELRSGCGSNSATGARRRGCRRGGRPRRSARNRSASRRSRGDPHGVCRLRPSPDRIRSSPHMLTLARLTAVRLCGSAPIRQRRAPVRTMSHRHRRRALAPSDDHDHGSRTDGARRDRFTGGRGQRDPSPGAGSGPAADGPRRLALRGDRDRARAP